MKKKLKNLFLESCNDRDENFLHLSKDTVGDVTNIDFDNKHNYVKIEFSTTYGKDLTLVAQLNKFKSWMSNYLKDEPKTPNVFLYFVHDFIESSNEVEEKLDEIIDDHGNIYGNGDKAPNNATNRMVGANHVWDLDKIMTRSMPKSVRNYSGNLGMGTVVW